MKKILLSLPAALLLFSCSKIEPTEQQPDPVDKSTPMYRYIKQMGYRDSEIREQGNNYVVDGDMLFSKTAQPDISESGNGATTEQYGLANYVGYNIQPNITIRADASMSSYTAEIDSAIALWNNIPNFRVHFTKTVAINQYILISDYNPPTGDCGGAYCPLGGAPGSQVYINTGAISWQTFDQRTAVIAHELGHAIGLNHTNWQPLGEPRIGQKGNGAYYAAMHLMGTPTGADNNSLMNGGNCGSHPTTLSSYDLVAAQFLYPANAPASGSVPVFRYWNNNVTQDHFYTINFNELGNGHNTGYIFEGIAFFAFSTQVTGSVPVYQYFCNNTGDHLYTANYSELGGGTGCYSYQGPKFYAYPSAINGSVPVYRYWNGSVSDHFYTKNQGEFSVGTLGYSLENTSFYAY